MLSAALAAYFALHEHLRNLSLWWDVAVIAVLVIPAVFATVWLLLPLRTMRVALARRARLLRSRGRVLVSELGGAGVVRETRRGDLPGWIFLDFFEEESWVIVVALIIPWVDAYSVWRGPTNTIVHHHKGVFERLSFAFPVPGENNTANLASHPDLVFFALFLGAAAQYRLRVRLTWLLMTASFGVTIVLAVWRDLGGLPALPLLSLAFLVANGDILWRHLRQARAGSAPQNA